MEGPQKEHKDMARSVEDIEQFSIDDDYDFEEDIVQSTSRTYLTHDTSRSEDTDTQSQVQVDPPRQRGVARAVACVAITFLVVCLLMVGASLFMSKDIDSKGNYIVDRHRQGDY